MFFASLNGLRFSW